MNKRIAVLVATFVFFAHANAQRQPSRFLVKFTDKGNSPYSLTNPSAFLSQRSIARRTRYNIPLDSTDLPITPRYIDSLKTIPTVLILNKSKWLNQVSVKITDTTAANITAVQNRINSFPFVRSYSAIAMVAGLDKNAIPNDPSTAKTQRELADVYNYGPSANQIKLHNGEFLHNIGLRGNNMIVGVLDGGFYSYLTLKAFDSARANGQILGTWDFVANDTSVNEDHPHGMECLSIIVGNVPGELVGSAPKASAFLFRTEDVNSETPIEEHNWVCGAERVDSSGGDVISSSLGYNVFDAPFTSHTYAELNGNTTMAAIGADLAAKKGLLVVNAAGNEGANSWGKIITPADGDSVLAVGAVTATGVAASFTSRGPSSDGQVKPDVASMGVGTMLQLTNNTIGPGNGTSFACPNMAGLTTCLWQGFQEFNNMKIIDALRKAGSRASNPNDTIGYGIPDLKKAMLNLLHDYSTASAVVTNCKTNISWNSKDVSAMKYEIERSVGVQPFTKVSENFGTGSSFAAHNYSYSDTLININAGQLTYRILQIIDTSVAGLRSGYIDTLTVNLAASCIPTGLINLNPAAGEIILQPNPAHSKLSVRINTPNPIHDLRIRIIDATGREMNTLFGSKGSGTITVPVEIASLAKGKYFVSIYDGNTLIGTKQLLKL
jgi:serine protease AprX